MIHLTPRLQALAECVSPGGTVADICTDHAFLPVYLVQHGVCPLAIAIDLNRGPYLFACGLVRRWGLESRISVRLGDGLKALLPGEAETAVVAGVGGSTISEILAGAPEVASSLKRLVLQPMTGFSLLRAWLAGHGWRLVAEDLVLEEERYYLVEVAEPGSSPVYTEMEMEVGPLLLAKRHPLLAGYMAQRVQGMRRIAAQMERSTRSGTREQISGLSQKIADWEQVMKCLANASK